MAQGSRLHIDVCINLKLEPKNPVLHLQQPKPEYEQSALSARWHVSMNYNKYLTDQASTVRASYIAHSNNL